LETTYGWYWAADTLQDAGAEVHLAHPLRAKAFAYRRVKNDELDARDLADLLRMNRLPEAWIAPEAVRQLRALTRYRIKLVRMRTSCKDQIHATLAKRGIAPQCTDIFETGGRAWLDSLPLPSQEPILQWMAIAVEQHIAAAEEAFGDLDAPTRQAQVGRAALWWSVKLRLGV
jgi:transposase